MKTYDIEELDKIFEEDTYSYVALYNDANKVLIHYPPNTTPKKDRWQTVKKRLQSKGLPDGYYQIKGKGSPDKKVTADVFYFKKGDVEEKDLPITQLADPPEKVDHVLTYEAAIKSNKDISELTAEISRLKMEIKQKDECIEDLELDIKDFEIENEELSERGNSGGGKQYLEDLMTAAIPIADRYFDLENRKLAFKERQNGKPLQVSDYQSPEVQREPKAEQQPPGATKEDAKKFWEKMGNLLENDPEQYQRIMQEIQLETVDNE
ncbi:MAG: hypothetical protein IH845_04830 [Nanoarchaeota archaeon]|nr:hypothetical protein [Nanoarchaeota archaeon]